MVYCLKVNVDWSVVQNEGMNGYRSHDRNQADMTPLQEIGSNLLDEAMHGPEPWQQTAMTRNAIKITECCHIWSVINRVKPDGDWKKCVSADEDSSSHQARRQTGHGLEN